jgi:arsenic resistance protein ArsH
MGSFINPRQEPRTLAQCPHLPISEAEDDTKIRTKYRPFLLDPEEEITDWISRLELETAITMAEQNITKTKARIKVLVLYGSLRKRFVVFSASACGVC